MCPCSMRLPVHRATPTGAGRQSASNARIWLRVGLLSLLTLVACDSPGRGSSCEYSPGSPLCDLDSAAPSPPDDSINTDTAPTDSGLSDLGEDCSDETSSPCCQAVSAERRIQLVDHDLWRVAEPQEDPFRVHRPADIRCDATGRQAEDFAGTYSFGIDTALCAYTTVIQESATDLCPGDDVLVWLWRFALTGPEGANAHIAAMVGDELLFEDVIPIPATSGLKVETYTAKRFHPAGTPITFHIRNHGDNTYQLLEIARCLGDTCRPD